MTLLSNAVRYAPADSAVKLTAGAEPGDDDARRLILQVADAGPGIEADEQEAIFRPYYHVDDGHKHGPGMGLAVSREIARQMGGDVTVTSKPGQGATFTFSFTAKAE
jgi:two-component system aerobic respiration control sensor histidine kinase ArcB